MQLSRPSQSSRSCPSGKDTTKILSNSSSYYFTWNKRIFKFFYFIGFVFLYLLINLRVRSNTYYIMYSTPHPARPIPTAKTQYRKFETNIPRILKNIKINMKTKFLQKNIGFLRLRNPTIGIDIFKDFFTLKTYKSIWP